MPIHRHRLYVTRADTFGLQVGGIDRLRLWPMRPHLKHGEEEFLDAVLQHFDFTSPVRWLSGKVFRKLGDGIGQTVWDELTTGAFPGIAYEEWVTGFVDHPDAIGAYDWIGQIDFLHGDHPFPGGIQRTLLVTGPFDERARWRGDVEGRPEDALCWFSMPKHQDTRGWNASPFDGRGQHDFWSDQGYSDHGFLRREDLVLAGWSGLLAAVDAATAGRNELARGWSAEIPIWIDVRPAVERDWGVETWL